MKLSIRNLAMLFASTLTILPISAYADKPKTEESSKSTLVFTASEENKKNFLLAGIPKELHNSSIKEMAAVDAACYPRVGGTDGRFLSVVGAYLAPKLVGILLKEVDKSLEKTLKKYSNTHKAEKAFYPYKASDDLALRSNCFRYSRFTETKTSQTVGGKATTSSKRDLEFDLIVQWTIVDKQYLKMRPLRLYMKNPSVPLDADKLSLAVSAKLTGTWRDENEGKSKEVFNTVILKEKLSKPKALKVKSPAPSDVNMGWSKGMHFYKRVTGDGKSNWTEKQALPIMPYSAGFAPDRAIANLEISVAEVGDGRRKKTLKALRKGLKFFNDDLTSVLEEAAKGIFEKEEPPVDETNYFCATFTTVESDQDGVVGEIEWNDSGDRCASEE